jgi:hypothetical protein
VVARASVAVGPWVWFVGCMRRFCRRGCDGLGGSAVQACWEGLTRQHLVKDMSGER